MWNAVKVFAKSAPVWAWILMGICLVAIVVGLIVAGNRTTHAAALESGVTTWTVVVSSGVAHF